MLHSTGGLLGALSKALPAYTDTDDAVFTWSDDNTVHIMLFAHGAGSACSQQFESSHLKPQRLFRMPKGTNLSFSILLSTERPAVCLQSVAADASLLAGPGLLSSSCDDTEA